MAELPNRIRELRTARDWSLDFLAEKVGCSKVQISDLERGGVNLTVEWMRRVAPALGVTPAELLTVQDNPLLLSDAERDIIERYRAATAEQQHSADRVIEALLPILPEDQQKRA